MKRLLSVDWDFFFETKENDPEQWQLYDWGHNEGWGGALQEVLWITRAAGFDNFGIPRPVTSGDEIGFWDRFTFDKDAKLFVYDSHSQAAGEEIMEGIDEVWNFDAHHDCGYSTEPLAKVFNNGQVDCSDWMLAFWLMNPGVSLNVVYPRWRGKNAFEAEQWADVLDNYVSREVDDGKPFNGSFSRVFIAKSSTWSPPWLDDAFQKFIESCPVPVEVIEGRVTAPRHWDEADVKLHAEASQKAMKMWKGADA